MNQGVRRTLRFAFYELPYIMWAYAWSLMHKKLHY